MTGESKIAVSSSSTSTGTRASGLYLGTDAVGEFGRIDDPIVVDLLLGQDDARLAGVGTGEGADQLHCRLSYDPAIIGGLLDYSNHVGCR